MPPPLSHSTIRAKVSMLSLRRGRMSKHARIVMQHDQTIGSTHSLLRTPAALVTLLCVTSVLGMLGFASFSALLPEFQRAWGLNNTEAGWISGIFYAGYVAGVPLLVGSTDRIDPRRIYLL